jgi:RNA polymerase sigma-70 factor, ECF subfamily
MRHLELGLAKGAAREKLWVAHGNLFFGKVSDIRTLIKVSWCHATPPGTKQGQVAVSAVVVSTVRHGGPDDDELVRDLLAGSRRGYEELFRRYSTPIFRYALSLTRNQIEAEDVVQEVFINAFAKLNQYRGPGAFKRWLFRICRNLTFNRLQKRRVPEAPLENQPESLFDGGEPQKEWLQHVEVEESTKRLLSSLAPDLQEIMVLRLVEDLSYREIAEITGLTEMNLRQMVSRGLAKLRKEWSADAVHEV